MTTTTTKKGSFFHKGFKGFFLLLFMSFFSFPFVSAYDLNSIFSTNLSFSVFILLCGIMLFLLLFGVWTRLPTFLLLGFFILFVIGGFIQAGSVLIPSGDIRYQYGDNFSPENTHWDNYSEDDFPTFSPSDKAVYLFHEQKEFIPFEGDLAHIIGLFLMVISVFAMLFSIFIGVGGGSF